LYIWLALKYFFEVLLQTFRLWLFWDLKFELERFAALFELKELVSWSITALTDRHVDDLYTSASGLVYRCGYAFILQNICKL